MPELPVEDGKDSHPTESGGSAIPAVIGGAIILGILGVCGGFFAEMVAAGLSWHASHSFIIPFALLGIVLGGPLGMLVRRLGREEKSRS